MEPTRWNLLVETSPPNYQTSNSNLLFLESYLFDKMLVREISWSFRKRDLFQLISARKVSRYVWFGNFKPAIPAQKGIAENRLHLWWLCLALQRCSTVLHHYPSPLLFVIFSSQLPFTMAPYNFSTSLPFLPLLSVIFSLHQCYR